MKKMPLLVHARISRRDSGAALVIVMAFLVMILGLAITFLARTSIERNASSSYVAGITTRQLADTAVNIVQTQIRSATTLGNNVAWASQPGMIRAYGSGSAGNYTASSDLLLAYKLYSSTNLVASSAAGLAAADLPPANWAANPATWTDLNTPVVVKTASGTTTNIYPIVDPSMAGKAQGFSINNAPGSTADQPAPMPVRWLYVLKDGTVAGATGSGSNATVSLATSTNPITGRIAFWTDDETCKVNINTAAGDLANLGTSSPGAFWDIPRMSSTFDKNLAKNQPVKNEFQRYPGHPATVSLSSVLTNLTRDQIASLAPRIGAGKSAGGMASTYQSPSTTIIDSDRLYASTDELAFRPDRTAQSSISTSDLSKIGFLLTASSRAPELNLFGKPRIALWPLNSSSGSRTVVDNLIARCSSIPTSAPFYFQRSDSTSPTTDAAIARNKELYAYLQQETSALIPGFGGKSFSQKYGANDTDQILTEIEDFIRCVNIRDAQSGAVPFTRKPEPDPQASTPGAGQITPLQNANGTMGFGRFYSVSEAALVFMATTNSIVATNAPAGTLPQATGMKALLFFELFSPALGFPYLDPGLNFKLTVSKNATVNGVEYPFCATEDFITGSSSGHERPMGGGNGIAVSLRYFRSGKTDSTKTSLTAVGSGAMNKFGFITLEIPLAGNSATVGGQPAGETFEFGGLTATLTIAPFNGSSVGATAQTIALDFPATTLPAPLLSPESKPNTRFDRGVIGGTFSQLIMPEDTVISLEPTGAGYLGDFRQVAMRSSVPATAFLPQQRYTGLTSPALDGPTVTVLTNGTNVTLSSGNITTAITPARKGYNNKAHSLRLGNNFGYFGAQNGSPSPLNYDDTSSSTLGSWGANTQNTNVTPPLPFTGFTYNNGMSYAHPDYPTSVPLKIEEMDTDTAVGVIRDGPYINKPDASSAYNPTANIGANEALPYYTYDTATDTDFSFSANRQIASAVQMGSLPAGFRPWQTLLFRPTATTSSTLHPSAASLPRDYLLLDLFWMPVVEPYAISEPSSTAGRINLNYRIMPFSYIQRSTAVRAAMDSTMLTAIPETVINTMKGFDKDVGTQRFRLNTRETDGTLAYFEDRFNADRVFVSAAEICDIPLVPEGQTKSAMATYWDNKRITGDNARETPYKHLYPLFTTKGNTYTVHFRVQALKKAAGSTATVWDETKDNVTGEYRGSTTIERYISQDASGIPDYATADASTPNLENYYKWRTISNRQFAP